MLCFVVVMQSFIMNSHEVFIHIHQGCFPGTGAIVRLPQCQWSKHDGYGKISQCITTTKHSKAKIVCIFLGIYCILRSNSVKRPIRSIRCYWLPTNGKIHRGRVTNICVSKLGQHYVWDYLTWLLWRCLGPWSNHLSPCFGFLANLF